MEPIRVLHLTSKMQKGGGVENVIMNYYRNINRNKIQFDFLIHSNDRSDFDFEIENLGGKIHRVTYYRNNLIQNIIQTSKIMRKHKEYNIIHIHTSSGCRILDGLIARVCGKQNIIFHSHAYRPKKKMIYKLTTPFFHLIGSHFFACSKAAGKYFFGNGITKKRNFRVINNAIDLNKYIYNQLIRDNVRACIGIEKEFVIGHVGRFVSDKNHKFILRVFKEVCEIYSESRLLLIGNGELEEEIKLLTEKMDISDKVIFTGVSSKVNELLQVMDIFLFPSKYEGLGMALIEAQAAGLFCVASNSVPQESDITGNVKFLDADKMPLFWANEIIKNKDSFYRKNEYDNINKAGYNLLNEVKKLENFYINLANH